MIVKLIFPNDNIMLFSDLYQKAKEIGIDIEIYEEEKESDGE